MLSPILRQKSFLEKVVPLRFDRKWLATVALVSLLTMLGHASSCLAIDEFEDVKRIGRLPVSEMGIRNAFENAQGDVCEVVGEGEPLELSAPIRYLTNRDRKQKKPPLPASRTGFLSIGLELLDSDRADLPVLSRSRVVEYLDSHYVLLETRVRRDLLDRKPYYHHRPIALTARYTGPRISVALEPMVVQTTRNIRSLGVFVDSDAAIRKAEQLRTLVLIYLNEIERSSVDSNTPRRSEQYEWVFVRGVESASNQSLVPHVFVTEENRTKLVYLHQFQLPARVERADVIGRIAITGFDRSGIYPESYVTRSYQLQRRLSFDWEELNIECMRIHGGGLESHLNQMLDAIISGQIATR